MSDAEFFNYFLCGASPSNNKEFSNGQYLEPFRNSLYSDPHLFNGAESESVAHASGSPFSGYNDSSSSYSRFNVLEPEHDSTVWVKDLIGSSESSFFPPSLANLTSESKVISDAPERIVLNDGTFSPSLEKLEDDADCESGYVPFFLPCKFM